MPEFLPFVRRWFTGAFTEATRPQREGWEAIATGHDTLIVAPTGSGKTLAAFLWALDHLHRLGAEGPEPLPVRRVGRQPAPQLRRLGGGQDVVPVADEQLVQPVVGRSAHETSPRSGLSSRTSSRSTHSRRARWIRDRLW